MEYWNENNMFYAKTKQGEVNYIDLSSINRKGKNIDWKSVSHETIPFRYMNTEDTLILRYNKGKCTLEYKGNKVEMQVTNIKRVKLNQLINKTPIRVFQDYNKGDRVKGCEVLAVKKVNYKTYYLLYNIKEEVHGVIENQKLRNIKTNNYVPHGTVPVSKMLYNNLYARKVVKHKEDLFNYRDTSKKYVDIKCDKCGKESKVRVNQLVSTTHVCYCQKNKSSFPERFIQAILDTLNIEYQREVRVRGLGDKRFDFYLPNEDLFIEVNGLQHYKPIEFMNFERTVLSDKAKQEWCKKNKKQLLIIDARKSTYTWLLKEVKKYFKIDSSKVIKHFNNVYR